MFVQRLDKSVVIFFMFRKAGLTRPHKRVFFHAEVDLAVLVGHVQNGKENVPALS